jgi:hypothetical protein
MRLRFDRDFRVFRRPQPAAAAEVCSMPRSGCRGQSYDNRTAGLHPLQRMGLLGLHSDHSKQVKFLCITAADRRGVDHKAQVRVRRRENVAVESDRSYDR